jgi:outer membrane lipoprotein SlyB
MRVLKTAMILSTLAAVAACGRDAQPAPPQQHLTWLDSLMTQPAQPVAAATPTELNQALVTDSVAPQALVTAAPVKAPARTSSRPRSTTRHRSTARRSSSGSSGTYASSSGTYQPRTRRVTHKTRDAAIGAGAGAVIGAVAGGRHHRVRGAVVGGVLGGVAGAVIGNNTDARRVQY